MLKALNHPGRLIPVTFSVALTIGTLLLMLPVARADSEQPGDWLVSAFTAVSATCITGLAVVDTPTYWSGFGQAVILLLVQVGGFGIMTLATLFALVVTGRLGLQSTLVAQAESHSLNIGDVVGIVKTVGISMLGIESFIALVLTVRFATAYDYAVGPATWHGVFHAVSAFNNAGFALYSDNLMSFNQDVFVLVPIFLAIVAGGVGFPVFYELGRRWRVPRTWSVHTRVTLIGYVGLFLIGTIAFGFSEWRNPGTLGPMTVPDKMLNSVAGGIMPRTAGFNTIDYSKVNQETWAVDDVMMFIGGGSAGTSGGIKVGTFVLLAFVIWTVVRGERDVVVGHRRVPRDAIYQAISVALLAVGVVGAGVMSLLIVTEETLDRLVFEAISAFGTTGLSTGITASLPPAGQLVLMALMYVGRVGTVTTATALALNSRRRHYRLPEEHPLVG